MEFWVLESRDRKLLQVYVSEFMSFGSFFKARGSSEGCVGELGIYYRCT